MLGLCRPRTSLPGLKKVEATETRIRSFAPMTAPIAIMTLAYRRLTCLRNKATNVEMSTTDPGRALITGKWADIGKVKGPILRGLAARAPYFHNGSAAGLKEVIQFYNVRFSMGLTDAEQADLVAFLSAL